MKIKLVSNYRAYVRKKENDCSRLVWCVYEKLSKPF